MSTQSLSPYLCFDGNCEEAFRFYAKCLGVTLDDKELHRYVDMPKDKQSQCPVPPGWDNKLMHVSLNWNGFVLMGADWQAPGQAHQGFHGITLSLCVDDPEQAEQLFNAFSQGGKITMPLAPTFWAKRFGMLTDRFGVSWMVNCE